MIKQYILENWNLILITVAFVIVLNTTIFLNKKSIRRMYITVILVFLLSLIVFFEFYLAELGTHKEIRTVLTAIRYSATPFVMAMVLFTLVRKVHWLVFVPAIIFAVINFISIFTGIVFSITDANTLVRGPLGYLPYIAVGFYSVFLVYKMFKHCNKQASEIIPIVFMGAAFLTGIILPFFLGKDYSKIFCSTIMIALFVYHIFSMLQLTSTDALTGLFNRHAFYATIDKNGNSITGVVSIDMNGLKAINDKEGHLAGDEALETISHCFMKAKKVKQSAYRIGGDEFAILCMRSSEEEINELINTIKKLISETKYHCAIGYSYSLHGEKTIDQMIEESDAMMYEDKANYYAELREKKYKQ